MYNRINNSFILAVIGFLIIVVSLLLKIIIFPVIVDNKVRDAVILENGTEAIQRWQNPPPLDFNVYFFNVTNPLEVHVGAKPIVQEVGPFVYTEYHDKKIIKFHDEDDTVSYNITKQFFFNQEKSKNLLETDKVTLLNPALMGTVLMVQKLFPFGLTYINEAIPYLFPEQKTIFATATVHEFLFGGVLINCSHKSGPGRLVCDGIKGRTPVTVQQLPHSPNYVYSFFAHKNATTIGPYRVKRGRNDVTQIGQIQEFEEKEALTVWGANNTCNTIRGTDSTVFPPFLKKTDMIYIFIPDVCGSMFAEFSANMEVDNIETLKFVGSRKNFADPKKYPQNQCHCEEAGSDEDGSIEIDGVAMTCPKEGAMFLTECYKAPVVLSQPHFYLADKSYVDFPQGLSPNETKHETYLQIEPRTGTPVEGYKRLQMNMFLDIVPNIDILEHVSSGLMPILWVEEGFTLNEEHLSLLRSFYKVLSVLYYIPWFLILGGLALYLIAVLISDNPKSVFCCFLNTARRVENMQNHVAESGIYYTDSIKSSVPEPPVTEASKDTPLFTSLTEYRNYYSGGSNNK